MRAREADQSGYANNDGTQIYYEVHGNGEPTLLLLPTSPIQHSRMWKGQVPYLARHFRVVTYDGRGNGKSDRPQTNKAYTEALFVADAVAVLDRLGLEQVVAAGLCDGGRHAVMLAADHPERVLAVVGIAPGVPLTPTHPHYLQYSFEDMLDTEEGWAKCNRHYWLKDYEDYLWFFFGEMIPEPHSTKQIEDCVGWALDTTVETQLLAEGAPWPWKNRGELQQAFTEMCARVRCRVLVIHGSEDGCQLPERGAKVAELTEGKLVALEGAGHLPIGREPVKVNLLMRDFVHSITPASLNGSAGTRNGRAITWRRASQRPKRALFISSPIGLGHIQRDLAIARELRKLEPDLEIHWWTQHPATRVLEEAGETIHPLSFDMASESSHWEEESTAHELHAFYAFRRMDEIFLANFMLFHDLVSAEPYDLWIGDESWEVDFFLHENPELKTAPYVFLSDVIGFLPVDPEGDPREIEITADYNAEMIEQRARYPYLRDLSLYIGDYEDLPDATFGPGLPKIEDWAREWFEAVGYVVPFSSAKYRNTKALRKRLGHTDGHPLLFAAVGGTSIGRSLLHKTAEAFALLKQQRPNAHMVMVCGPRIEPDSLPDVEGLEKRPYVHNLFEHLACADAAVVQGGLSTTMELVATGRPFVYFPLQKHWEQVHHVQTRLELYGAGRGLNYASTTAEVLAEALGEALDTPVSYRKIRAGGARRAAKRIASLL